VRREILKLWVFNSGDLPKMGPGAACWGSRRASSVIDSRSDSRLEGSESGRRLGKRGIRAHLEWAC
jgi:hypothetical protein